MVYLPQVGDIILKNSEKTGAKIVKFLMQSPTVWHQLYNWATKKLTPIPYYHTAMFYEVAPNPLTLIQQEWKVEFGDWNDTSIQIIFRRKDLTLKDKALFVSIASKDIGQGYDIWNIIGKTITWLTGIKWFANNFHWGEARICDARVSNWMRRAFGEYFGGVSDNLMTTQIMYEWLLNNNNYEVVYKVD